MRQEQLNKIKNAIEDSNLSIHIKNLISALIQENETAVNTGVGVMEIEVDQKQIVKHWIEILKDRGTLKATLIPASKHHHADMIHISEDPKDDVAIWHMEISENGTFFYVFDDGVS